MELRHLISIEDVSVEWWDELYALACDIIREPRAYADSCKGHVMASLFFEPSTRTNFSFQTAMLRLGGSIFGFSDPSATSSAKGETLADTIRMVSSYSDVIVMRNPREGAAMAASMYSEVPLINAGDGGHMHPTQTLTDLTTISQKFGSIGGITVGLCGDLKNGRTVHSLVLALSKFPNINFFLIAPRDLAMPDYMLAYMRAHGQKYIEITSLESAIPQLDVLYMTRIQRERFIDPLEYDRLKGVYVLTRRKLERAKKHMLVMHPLPRVDEIATDVDDDPRAVYFEQARYGMFIRMALLHTMLKQGRIRPESVKPFTDAPKCINRACITQFEPYLPRLTKESDSGLCCAYCDKVFY
ncbi:MAG: aspartate carbamoyltransferase [Oscillospiraceae bacterium]|nr:aspartate carbamoyltransferase [Oscillospiraceae bacterium]